MVPQRYRILNSYTLEELRRDYTRADAKGRIEILKTLNDGPGATQIPYEIAHLAVTDSHVEVREWIARNGKWLDYSERNYSGANLTTEFPEHNLEEKLKNDPDPFVRACLQENATVLGLFGDALNDFRSANHLERLALMHNPEMWSTPELLERLFNHEDTDLAITLEERKELIVAFLSNTQALSQLVEQQQRLRPSWPTPQNATAWLRESTLSILYNLASKWPKSPDFEVRRTTRPVLMPHYVYVYLPADDLTKWEVYQKEEDELCRLWILQSCTGKDVHTLRLGRRDQNKQNRQFARDLYNQTANDGTDDQMTPLKRDWKSILLTLGLALIILKLYFAQWSDFAFVASLLFLLVFPSFDAIVTRIKWRINRKRRNRQLDLDKAFDLIGEGNPPEQVAKETGLSLRSLKREGVLS